MKEDGLSHFIVASKTNANASLSLYFRTLFIPKKGNPEAQMKPLGCK